MNRMPVLLLLILLAAALQACNLPSSQPAPAADAVFTAAAQTIEAELTASAPGETSTPEPPTATATLLPDEPTSTPAASATATSLPCNAASFVSDVSIPDGANILVGQSFTKTWRLRNSGSCSWNASYQLVFKSGESMSGPASKPLTNNIIAPGATLDVSVDLKAPASPGTYKGFWELRDPNGSTFGLSSGAFWVEIKAVSATPQSPSIPGWPTVKQGDESAEVYALQQLLRFHGAGIAADGKFGPQTFTAVKNFQTNKGLASDGIVGSQTWSALIQGAQATQGATGEHVRAIQYLLKNKFGSGINVDGIFGPQTAQAVKDFQTQKGLTSDGIVGPQTWQALVAFP